MARTNLKRLEEGKLYYSISEVCAMTGLEQHVLRYWESEFPQLRPKKNRSGNRAYRAKEIKVIRYIRHLLYEEMFTIPGAKKKMAEVDMSGLDGQLSLLRMAEIPAPAAVKPPGNLTDTPAAGSAPGGPESIPGGGPEALRQELVRVKKELQDLLAAFGKLGRSAP